MSMKVYFFFIIALMLFLNGCGISETPTPELEQAGVVVATSASGTLLVEDAYINATPLNGALYFTLQNQSNQADKLLGVESGAAHQVELHESVMDGNMMSMQPLEEGIEVPAGGEVRLEPGGKHVMLVDLTRQLATGDKIAVTLNFEQAGAISFQAEVAQGTASTDNNHDGDAHKDEANQPEEHEHKAEASLTNLAALDLAADQKLNVVATTTILGDIVEQVGGEMIDLTVLLPLGADPHTFQPTPRDLATVADAHAVFVIGMGLETFLSDMLEQAGGTAAIIYASEGVEPRELLAHEVEQERHIDNEQPGESAVSDAHEHLAVDPHVWTSPANVMIFVDNIERAFSSLDPANAAGYQANAKTYKSQLEALDSWIATQIDTIPPQNRKLVTDHVTFGYYADRYGLEQVGAVIPSFSTNAAPSAQELAQLESAVRDQKIKAVFVGNTVNPALAEQLAVDTGIRLLTLYTGSLGPAGSGVESYLDYMRYNTETIVKGLE
jgi:ABC-type Zn uptake system ZnuABC Zn-binding protein ZnuA